MADGVAVADRIVVLRLGRNAVACLTSHTTPDAVVAAITGSSQVTSGKDS
jgi:ABC-type sugar transport system ATPase subunit